MFPIGTKYSIIYSTCMPLLHLNTLFVSHNRTILSKNKDNRLVISKIATLATHRQITRKHPLAFT